MAVIFDMDGVLIDNGDYHFQAWKIFCEKYGIPFSEEIFRSQYFGQTNELILSGMFEKGLTKAETETLASEKEEIYRTIYAPYIQPVNGLIPFIKMLKTANIAIGIATSAPKKNVDFVLNALNIENQIDVIVYDSMVSKSKPHPEIYLKAAELLKTKPSACVVFEDSLSGTKSAYDAGAKVIALTTTLPAEKHRFANKIIKDFTEVNLKDIQF